MQETERSDLRHELQNLKDCQVRYFQITVTATGLLIGIGSQIGQERSSSLLLLAPLIMILPCWWIFFDKATTITRIVGYLRILETMIITNSPGSIDYVGWENSLRRFRERQDEEGFWRKVGNHLLGIWRGLPALIPFLTTHRYWVINWYAFFVLGFLCIFLSRPSTGVGLSSLWFWFMVLFAVSSVHNLSILGNLVDGTYTYRNNERVWRNILRKEGQ